MKLDRIYKIYKMKSAAVMNLVGLRAHWTPVPFSLHL